MEFFRSQNKKLYCCLIDFPSSLRLCMANRAMEKKLLHTSINGKFFMIVFNMDSDIKSSISINGANSLFFACERGVRQGENISPFLFVYT